jgi:TonB family protein
MPQPDSLGRYFAGSVGVHAAIVGLIVLSGIWKASKNEWGSEHASTGSVGIEMVKSIPIPRTEAPENPLANDSKSNVPQAPAPVQLKEQVKVPEPAAIEIPDKKKRKVSPKVQSPAAFRPAMQYQANQVYSQTPQALSSKMYGIQGANGVDVGPATELGNRFGAYVDEMRRRISAKWNQADVRSLPSQYTAISFVIARNGAVSNVTVSHPSGNILLDTSAKRAVEDVNPLAPLPPAFEHNQTTVEIRFQVSK